MKIYIMNFLKCLRTRIFFASRNPMLDDTVGPLTRLDILDKIQLQVDESMH